jgi:hypothetical protein
MDWKRVLAYVSGSVDEDLLLKNEYLVAENRILRAQIEGGPKLNDSERRTLAQYTAHHHEERPHQGKGNVILFPSEDDDDDDGEIRCRARLGGLLKHYYREAG